MKYVIDTHGLDWTLQQVEALLPQPLRRVPLAECEPRPPQRRDAHVGVHAQRQPGLVWLGVPVPAARLQVAQMHGIADIAERFGSGTLRLTVWQNLLISDVPQARVAEARTALQALGLDCEAGPVRAGMVACTGNQGCKFAAADTKRHAQQIIDWLEPALFGPALFEPALSASASASASEPVPAVPRVPLAMDTPINIHLTGCHHSCAQHYIGDIGLLAAKVPRLAEGVDTKAGTEVVTEVDTEIDNEVEGYHLYVGGGHGEAQAIAVSLLRDVPASHLPGVIESLLRCYLQQRRDASESFLQFSQRPGQGQGLGQGMQALRSALVDSHPALMARNQTGDAS